jgi:hypothetical protein
MLLPIGAFEGSEAGSGLPALGARAIAPNSRTVAQEG